jgi:hypothetical protein
MSPYLNRAILNAVAYSTRHRLLVNQDTFELQLNLSCTPWKLPYLGFTPNSDISRVNQDFLTRIPQSTKRVLFLFDNIQHDLFDHIPQSLCSIQMQRKWNLIFDPWAVEGIEFLSTVKRFPVIIAHEEWDKVFEMYLACLVALEMFADESEFPFKSNLTTVAQRVLNEYQNYRGKNGLPLLNYQDSDLKPTHQIAPVIRKLCSHPLIPKELQKEVAPPIQNKGPSPETIKLLSEEIPSITAFQKDPSLKNPSALTKRGRAGSNKKVDRKAEERAGMLIEAIEPIILSDNPNQNLILNKPWHTILPKQQ